MFLVFLVYRDPKKNYENLIERYCQRKSKKTQRINDTG